MSESKNHFVFELLVLLCCISFQNVSGIKIKLTRKGRGDYFTNPYSTSADNDSDKFCLSTNAICFKDHPRTGDECRYCKCDKVKTFNETSLRCASIQDFGQGCRAWLRSDPIKLLDLTNSGETTLFTVSVKRARLARILRMNGMKVDFFTVKNKPYYKDNRLAIEVKWENVPKTTYDGQVFRVQISYRTYNKTNINDCFVFKSKGTINVTFPDLTTTSPLPSTSEKLTIQTSPFHTVPPITETIPTLATTPPLPLASEKSTIQTSLSHTVSHTPVTIPTLTTSAPSPSAIEKSTTAPLPKTKPGPTNVARKEESSGEGKDAIILSLAVVGCLLLLGVVILAVLWCRERSARLSQDKKNTEISLANGSNGSVEDPMVMSQVGSSQTEAGNSINSSEVDEDNHEYYNAEGDVDDNYASLDMTKAESKPTYQSLINVERDLLV